MEFDCKYAKPNGEVVWSVHAGHTAEDVRSKLQDQGFLPLAVRVRGRGLPFRRKDGRPAIKLVDFIIFNQQFAALVRAGLPIVRCLDLLGSRIKNLQLKTHVDAVRDRVVSGAALSEAMESEGVFPRVYTASVFAGERSGNLVEVLNRYVGYEKTMLNARKKFRNSLIYPAFLVVLSIVMVGVILGFVIPRFAALYAGFDTELPLPTRILIAVADAVQNSLIVVLPAIVIAAIALRVWIGSTSGRRWFDDIKLRMPVIGKILSMFAIAQLSRTLATLLEGGIPLVPALGVVQDASGNRVIASAVTYGASRVREGQSLSDALEHTGKFPDLALEMMRVGEETGALPEMLNHVADFYDEDVDLRVTALLGWIEPVILVFVACFVAAILVSLYLPIFSLGGLSGA